jgi:hypothetical protein
MQSKYAASWEQTLCARKSNHDLCCDGKAFKGIKKSWQGTETKAFHGSYFFPLHILRMTLIVYSLKHCFRAMHLIALHLHSIHHSVKKGQPRSTRGKTRFPATPIPCMTIISEQMAKIMHNVHFSIARINQRIVL